MKNIKLNEYWVHLYNSSEQAVEDFAVLFEFWKSGDATEIETQGAYDHALVLLDDAELDRKSTRLNSSHVSESRMPSSA